MIDVGDSITLTYPSKPAAPSSVTVTIGQPDGSSVSASALSGSYSFTPTQVGRHSVLWVSAGPSDSYSDAFDVAPADAGQIISLADAKAQLRMDRSDSDEELRLYLAATTEIVEHIVGRIVRRSWTETHNGGGVAIVVRKPPILTVTSLVEYIGQTAWTLTEQPYGQAADPYGFNVEDAEGGRIIRRSAGSWPIRFTPGIGNVVITYTSGRPVIPASMQIAARQIVAHLWKSRRLAGPKPASNDDVETQDVLGYAIPTQAVELLADDEQLPGIG